MVGEEILMFAREKIWRERGVWNPLIFVGDFWPLEISAAPGSNWRFQGRFIVALRLQVRKRLSMFG
jgi:hypothetical protein